MRAVIDRDAAWAIGVDVRSAPLDAARRTLAAASPEVSARIELRAGDGLAAIGVDEVDAIVIAGMGAASIIAILEAHPDRITPQVRLVLQPANEWRRLRAHLAGAQRRPVAEEIVWERDRPHLVLAVDAGPWRWDADDVDFGPLRSKGGEGYRRWLAAECARLEAIATCGHETSTWRERVRVAWAREGGSGWLTESSGAGAAGHRGQQRGDR